MSEKVPVKDFYNKTVGFIETDSNGNKIVKDFYNRLIGKYDAQKNVTKDFYNRIVGKGDQTGMLLGMYGTHD